MLAKRRRKNGPSTGSREGSVLWRNCCQEVLGSIASETRSPWLIAAWCLRCLMQEGEGKQLFLAYLHLHLCMVSPENGLSILKQISVKCLTKYSVLPHRFIRHQKHYLPFLGSWPFSGYK